ncbi:flavanone 3-dioxygenase 3-like [Phoenix dactylifera]|uniref:Flavanone 3-dioxygenase 3-like n=1 Tax=Phoenix dactylifera TaxID=42345 RepID=A0A8B8ZQ37_PHODC|nr:flavanone 3-dioxygenase 3-like [Phoenix dactylifera]
MAPPTTLNAAPLDIVEVNQKGVKHQSELAPYQSIVTPSSISTIPIINLHGLDDPSAKASIIKAIDKACTDWGLFLVVNHGIEESTIEEMLECVKAFFTLPLEEKMKYMARDLTIPVDYISQPNGTSREVLRHQGRPTSDEIILLWPSKPSNYKDAAKAFLEATWRLAMRLARAISKGLGKDEGYVEGTMEDGFQALGMGPHTDQCHMVILTDNVDGLQLKHIGKWVTVPNVPGALVVFLGTSMEKASEGRYKAAEHQVMVNEKTARISLGSGQWD